MILGRGGKLRILLSRSYDGSIQLSTSGPSISDRKYAQRCSGFSDGRAIVHIHELIELGEESTGAGSVTAEAIWGDAFEADRFGWGIRGRVHRVRRCSLMLKGKLVVMSRSGYLVDRSFRMSVGFVTLSGRDSQDSSAQSRTCGVGIIGLLGRLRETPCPSMRVGSRFLSQALHEAAASRSTWNSEEGLRVLKRTCPRRAETKASLADVPKSGFV